MEHDDVMSMEERWEKDTDAFQPLPDTAGGRADPKPEGRVRDPQLLALLHLEWRECVLCGANDQLSLHHINKHPRDDIRGNLCMLCGSGTTGCHGLIEARNSEKLAELGAYILKARGDTIVYLYDRMGPVAAQEWMRRNQLVQEEEVL